MKIFRIKNLMLLNNRFLKQIQIQLSKNQIFKILLKIKTYKKKKIDQKNKLIEKERNF